MERSHVGRSFLCEKVISPVGTISKSNMPQIYPTYRLTVGDTMGIFVRIPKYISFTAHMLRGSVKPQFMY